MTPGCPSGAGGRVEMIGRGEGRKEVPALDWELGWECHGHGRLVPHWSRWGEHHHCHSTEEKPGPREGWLTQGRGLELFRTSTLSFGVTGMQPQTPLYLGPGNIITVTCHLMPGLDPGECVLRSFRRCANTTECTRTHLGGTAHCTPKLRGSSLWPWTTRLYGV